MGESPYAPPRAPVKDPSSPANPPRIRPLPVVLAWLLIVVAALLKCLQLLRGGPYDIMLGVLWIAVLVFIATMVERGKNWARWILAALTIFHSLNLVGTLLWLAEPSEGTVYAWDRADAARVIAGDVCLAVACGLAFGPGRSWFRRPAN